MPEAGLTGRMRRSSVSIFLRRMMRSEPCSVVPGLDGALRTHDVSKRALIVMSATQELHDDRFHNLCRGGGLDLARGHLA